MNFSFTGFILLVVFVLPGAVWVGYFQGQFQARKLNATELVIKSVGFSLAVHFLLSTLIVSGLRVLGARADRFFEFLSRRTNELNGLMLMDYWILLLDVILYIGVSCACAYGLARVHCWVAKRLQGAQHRAVWLNFFGPTEANFVKARMNDGEAYIGQVKHYPFDHESIHSESRDIVLTGVVILEENGTIRNPAPGVHLGERVDVLLKTSDIKALELVRAPSDQA